jgi:hypothetical protein
VCFRNARRLMNWSNRELKNLALKGSKMKFSTKTKYRGSKNNWIFYKKWLLFMLKLLAFIFLIKLLIK